MLKKQVKVLVVPAGSRNALGIIKFLKKEKNIQTISADVDKLASGLYLSDKGYLISPFSREKKFFGDLEKIIKKEKIDIVIPTLDPLLIKFAENKDFFNNLKTKILISPSKAIFQTRDKWRTYNLLKDEIPVAKSFIDKKKVNIAYPLFIKPRDGSGSVNAFKINSKKELDFYFNKITNPIIQEYLDGEEYTVDCLTDMEGSLLSCVSRIRLETKDGVSIKGKIVKDKEIDNIAKKISEKIKFNGPFLFQLKKRGRKLMLIEINPRFGGGMPLSVAAGLNIYLLSVKLFLGEKIKIPKIQNNLYFTRFDEEIYLNDSLIRSRIKKP